MKSNIVHFNETDFIIREIEEKKDFLKAYRLRHMVYCESLKWVDQSSDCLEIDSYDLCSVSLGVFSDEDDLLGYVRIIPSNHTFMLEKEFRRLIPDDYIIRKGPDTAEITRLTTLVPVHLTSALQKKVSSLLYKGIYHWSLMNGVRYLYFVVEERFLRVLKRLGFPCLEVGQVTTLGGGVQTVAAILDWEAFRLENRKRRPDFLDWIANLPQKNPTIEPLQRPERDSVLPVFSLHSQHETLPSVR